MLTPLHRHSGANWQLKTPMAPTDSRDQEIIISACSSALTSRRSQSTAKSARCSRRYSTGTVFSLTNKIPLQFANIKLALRRSAFGRSRPKPIRITSGPCEKYANCHVRLGRLHTQVRVLNCGGRLRTGGWRRSARTGVLLDKVRIRTVTLFLGPAEGKTAR